MSVTLVSIGNNKIECSNGSIIVGSAEQRNIEGFCETSGHGVGYYDYYTVYVKSCLFKNPNDHCLMLFGFFTESCTLSCTYGNFSATRNYDGVYTVDKDKLPWWDYDNDLVIPTIIDPHQSSNVFLAIPYSDGDIINNPFNLPIFNIRSGESKQAASEYFTTPNRYMANGGGATHIAKVTGQLSSLSNNLSDILMVSGGGGGGLIIGEDTYAGKDAGGISGSGDNSANQTTGYAFGQGESGEGVSGGGGGLYGGYKGGTS